MHYLEKIQDVKHRLAQWQKNCGDEFPYVISGAYWEDELTGNTKEIISPTEEYEIIQYLANKELLKITKEKDGDDIGIKFLPEPKPDIGLRTLKLISSNLKDYYTTDGIIELLKETGIDEKIINPEQPKWLIFYSVFKELAISNNEKDKTLLVHIISNALHPLNLGGNEELAHDLHEKFNSFLKYDNAYIDYIEPDYVVFTDEDLKKIHSTNPEFEVKTSKEKSDEAKRIRQNKQLITQLRDYHQAYMDIIDIFCQNTKHPTKELNDAYKFLTDKITRLISQLNLKFHYISFYQPFKDDLYSAEVEWNGKNIYDIVLGPSLSWDSIRPSLHKAHSEIIKLVNLSEEESELSDEDKKLEEITNLISQRRTESKQTKERQKTKKIEITKMPDLNVKNIEDNTITKGKKRITLPKFPPTDWSKVEIRFLNEYSVYISTEKKQVPADFESLGFQDERTKKPHLAWKFLFELSKNNGESGHIDSPIPENIRQHKKKISDFLKKIFKNNIEPFYDFSDTNTYKLKIKLLPPIEDEPVDGLGIDEYLKETMASKYEPDNYQ